MKIKKKKQGYSCLINLLFIILSGMILLPEAIAASASIEVDGDEGPIPVSAVASFATCVKCSGSGENKKCTTIDTGTLWVTHNRGSVCGDSGHGGASCSKILNGGTMSQGDHTFIATATDCKGTATDSKTITIDNTPAPSISAGAPNGNMNAAGSVEFKENTAGNEGSISLLIDWYNDGKALQNYGSKSYEGTSISWAWEDIATSKSILNAGTMAQGTHRLIARATAANGTRKDATHVFTVDNTPKPTISAGEPNGDMKAKGSVEFKENTAGNEGSISLLIDWYNDGKALQNYGSKSYEETSISWAWEDIATSKSILNAGTMAQGTHRLIARATAANGTRKDATHVFTVDNTPESGIVTTFLQSETMDILGKTKFKDNATGKEGSVALYLREVGASSWKKQGSTLSYEGTDITWLYSDFTGSGIARSVWGDKELELKVVATAANYASSSIVKNLIIPALGTCSTGF